MTPFSTRPSTRSMLIGLGLAIGFATVTSAASAVSGAGSEATGLAAQQATTPPQPCFTDRTVPSTSAPKASAGIAVKVTATVASNTRMRLDSSGRVVAVGTNTGCAPKATDEFIIERGSGDKYELADAALVAEALACRVGGSWEDTKLWHACTR